MTVLDHPSIVYSMLECLLHPENDPLTKWGVVCLFMTNKSLRKDISTKVSVTGVRFQCFDGDVFQEAADEGFIDILEMFWRPPLTIDYRDKIFLWDCMESPPYAYAWLLQHRHWALRSSALTAHLIKEMACCLCFPESLPATWRDWLHTREEYVSVVLLASSLHCGKYSKSEARLTDPARKASEHREDFHGVLATLEAELQSFNCASTGLITEQLTQGLQAAVQWGSYTHAKRIYSVIVSTSSESSIHVRMLDLWMASWLRNGAADLAGLHEMPDPQKRMQRSVYMRQRVLQGLPDYVGLGGGLELKADLLCALAALSRNVLVSTIALALQEGAYRVAHYCTCVLSLLTKTSPNYGGHVLEGILSADQDLLLCFKTPQHLESLLNAHRVDIVALLDSPDGISLSDYFCRKGKRDFVVWAGQRVPDQRVTTKSILISSNTSIWDWALTQHGKFFDGLPVDAVLDGFRFSGSLEKVTWLQKQFPDVYAAVAEDLISVCAQDLSIVELVLSWLVDHGRADIKPSTVDAICPHIGRHLAERHGIIFAMIRHLLDRSSPVQAALLDRVQSYSLSPTPARKPTTKLDS